jgi:hypothetical protein
VTDFLATNHQRHDKHLSNDLSQTVTDKSLEERIHCVLLQNPTKETHKFTGELESSRIILRNFSLVNHTQYRAHIVTGLNQFVI